MTAPAWTPARVALGGALLMTAVVGGDGLVDGSRGGGGPWARLENATLDARFALRGARPAEDAFCIVTVDDRSLARPELRLDRRAGIAALVQALRAAGTRAIAFDALFTGQERILPAPLVDDIDTWLGQSGVVDGSPELVAALSAPRRLLRRVRDEARGDDVLARTFVGGDVVLALHTGSRAAREADGAAPVDVDAAAYGQQIAGATLPPTADHIVASLPELHAVAGRVGVVTVVVDRDDRTARTVHAGRTTAGRVLMPLGVALAAAAAGIPRGQLAYDANARTLHIGDRVVVADPAHRFWLNHPGPADVFCAVSAADVLDGKAAARLRGRVAVVGFTELGSDTVATPYAAQLPGAALHVTLAGNVLASDVLRPSPAGLGIVFVLGFGLLGALLFSSRLAVRALVRVAFVVLAGAAWCGAAHVVFVRDNIVLPVAGPLLALFVSAGAGIATAWLVEGAERRRVRRAFAHYLSDDVITTLLRDKTALSRGGERRRLTVLFSDIRGFTTMSEEMEPLALVTLLNAYFTPMTQAVLAHRGLLDKYIGDAVMAVFGAPLVHDRHVDDALDCVLTMHASLQDLSRDAALQGRRLEIGVGLNTGEMVVGNMGGAERFDYTVVGDAVNLASRIEGLTRTYGVFCLVGEATRQAAAARFSFREIDRVRVKGKRNTGTLFELLGDERRLVARYVELDIWDAGLAAYREGRFDAARQALSRFAAANPHDGASTVLLRRLDVLGEPPAAWDGVFEQRDKH